jgi:hypothetical protein
MGIHYVNSSLLKGPIDATQPQALIYEPSSNGQYNLVGVEFIILASALPPNAAPQVEGHLMLYIDGPNRYGLPPFFELHVWAWRANPRGPFVDWNDHVSCAGDTEKAWYRGAIAIALAIVSPARAQNLSSNPKWAGCTAEVAAPEVSRSQETLAYAVRFPVSDAEQHHRGIVSAPQEYIGQEMRAKRCGPDEIIPNLQREIGSCFV